MRGSDQIIFRAGGRDFTCADAVRSAENRSAVEPARQDARDGLSCQRYAEDEGFELDPDEVESAAESYRSDHDLTTADDTEHWLEEHELSLDDFSAWLERRFWRQRFLHDLPVIRRDYLPEPGEVDSLLWPEVVFGNVLPGFTRDLAARVAVRLASDHCASQPGWADDLAGMERLYLDRCREATTTGQVDRELATRQTSLIKLEVQLASFESAGAAREAWLCVTQDGERLDQVSRRAGADLQQVRLFLDELPEPLRQPALSAVPGDVIPPLEIGDRVVVCEVCAEHRPTIDDDQVRRRVESVLIERAIDDLIQRHIRWA